MFEFETKEQREAWRVISRRMIECRAKESHYSNRYHEEIDAAAARFDKREATCGIEPLSFEHGALLVTTRDSVNVWSDFERQGLVDVKTNITDKGREVLAALNAMCKVQS